MLKKLLMNDFFDHINLFICFMFQYTEGNISAAREVWRRACNVHLHYKPTIHWHWACFEDRYPANLDSDPKFELITGLEIFTELEKRLTDSALVCMRRADFMRRAGYEVRISPNICDRFDVNYFFKLCFSDLG